MTTTSDVRCSTFAIDLWWVSGQAPDGAIASHLADCAQCRAYVASLEGLAVDAWPVGRRGASAVARRGHVRRPWAWAVGGVAAAASLAIVVMARPRPQDEGAYVGAKGTPSVELLVRRGDATSIWDGQSPVRPGDTLALRVACEGLGHIAVAAPRDDGPARAAGTWARVVDASCSADPSEPLPFTLVVDGSPGQEHFAVVVSRAALDEVRVQSAVEARTRTRDTWTVRFNLPKVGATR